MRKINYLYVFRKNQEGSIIVIVALFMTILMGVTALVLDLGIAFNSKSKLQNALDSVALAAVRELPLKNKNGWSDVVEVAKDFARLNGIKDYEHINIIPLEADRTQIGEITSQNYMDVNGVKVSKGIEVNYSFAKIIGFNSGVINADAIAELKTAGGVSGLLPIAISRDLFNNLYANGTSTTIKFDERGNSNNEVDITGWRGAINFIEPDGKEATYQECIIDGYDEVVVVGEDYVNLNPGVMNISDLEDKYEGHQDCQYIDGKVYKINDDNVNLGECSSCPRLAIIPIINFTPTDDDGELVDINPNTDLLVEGIATVWITYVDSKTIDISAISDKYVVNGARAKEIVNDYGVRAAKLVD